ncbi:MAG: MlaD family protein [Xenococcaceae cyanobacterium]
MLRSRTIREGSVGLFALLGLVLFGGVVIWLRGIDFGKGTYDIIVEFPDVNGIQVGSPVRYRGVEVGRIKNIKPGTNGVDVTLEISPADLRIPHEVKIQTSRYGLIGETSIEITPLKLLPSDAQSINPVSSECDSNRIICDNARIQGETGASFNQLIPSLLHLSNLYGDPKFFENINSAAQNTSIAADRVAKLGDEMSLLSSTVRKEIKTFSGTANSLTRVANETSQLASNINGLVNENRGNLVRTLNSIGDTSEELRNLVVSLEFTVARVNSTLETLESANTEELMQNLETLAANAAEASANLRDISEKFNDPANMLVLQQTLDSARATFENAQKITADLDELTGDPTFRKNLRDLVNGLSDLVSSTQQLEQQVQTVQVLEPATQELKQQLQTNQALEAVNGKSNNTPSIGGF